MTISYTLFACQSSLQRLFVLRLTAYSVPGDNLSQSLKHILSPQWPGKRVSISEYIVAGDNICSKMTI